MKEHIFQKTKRKKNPFKKLESNIQNFLLFKKQKKNLINTEIQSWISIFQLTKEKKNKI